MNAAPNSSRKAGPRIGASQMIATPISERRAQFHADGIVRRRQHRLGQNVFQHLRVDFDARHGGIDRRRLQIEQARRRGADQDKPAGKHGPAGTRPSSTSTADT